MEFPVFLLKNIKRRFITYLILITLFCFFVITISVNAGLFGKKIKKISDNELKEIKVELNLSKDPNFYSYTDSMLKEALDKEINSQETPGLTFGSFILNALYEEKLVEMCYPNFDDKESSLFFSKLADNLSDWQKNFASKTTKLALQGVIEAYLKMPKLGIGTSTLFLAIDLVQINVAMAKLAKVIARKALFYYLFNRSQGDSHKTAWGEGIPPLYDNWQTESFFQSLWNKYGEAILSDNLDIFKRQQREFLRVLILQALNRPPNPPTNMIQFKSDGKTILKIGKTTTEKTVILKAKVSDPDGNKVRLQIELRRLDEYEGKFDEEKGGLQQSDLFENNSEVMIPIYGLTDGHYHWRARAIDEHGLVSKWVSFGGNPVSAVDFTLGQPVVAPVITFTLKTTPVSPYYMGDTINAEFSIINKGSIPVTFSVLTLGVRDPDDQVAYFTHRQNITLEPSESYDYRGTLTLNKVGDYYFFCTSTDSRTTGTCGWTRNVRETLKKQDTKEKLLIDSSLYRIECSKPIPDNYFIPRQASLRISVRGPADELALILTNPKRETDIKFISKRSLIDNFETVDLKMGEEPFSEGPYTLTVKTVTPEKVIYKKEMWFTSPKNVQITGGEITIACKYGDYRYYVLDCSITSKNEGDLPFFFDNPKIIFTTPGGQREKEELSLGHFIAVPSGEFEFDQSTFGLTGWLWYNGPSKMINATLRLHKNDKVVLTLPLKLTIEE